MARFASAHDRNFRPVVSRLEKFYKDTESRKVLDALEKPVLERETSSKSAFFEIPFLPCSTFRGREDLLSMEEHFHGQSRKAGGS